MATKPDLVFKFSGLNEKRYTHHLLKRPTRQSSEEYRLALETAEDSIEFLEEVLKEKEKNKLYIDENNRPMAE